MKKILAVGAMAAMLAGAAFAAPSFYAGATLSGSVGSVDTTGKWTVLDALTDGSSLGWAAGASGERAGASMENWGDGMNGRHVVNIWFKPVDMLTLSFTQGDWAGNKYGATLNLGDVTFEASVPGGFINNGAVKAGSSVKVAYTNDTIGSVYVKVADRVETDLDFDSDNDNWYYKETFKVVEGESVHDKYLKVPADCELTVGYSKDFGIVNVGSTTIVDFLVDETFLGEKLDLSTKIADLVSVNCGNIVIAKFADEASLEYWKTTLGCSVPVADLTAYLNITEKDWTNIDPFNMTFAAGVKGTLDVMSWDVGLNVDVNTTTTFSIPFTLSVGL